jgi:hypothetical protein
MDAKAFFENKALSPDEVIRRGRQRGLSVAILERAMVEVAESYDEVKDRDRDLVWRVWQAATQARGRIYKNVYLKRGTEIIALKRIIWLLLAYGIIATLGEVLRWLQSFGL